MKRRLFLLLGASTMSVTSLVGFTTATAAPASANGDVFVAIGYIIQCLTPAHLLNDFGICLFNAITDLAKSLTLPAFFPTSSNAAKVPAGSPLNLPANVNGILKGLPTPLQTTPVASAPSVNAPLKQLIPTFSPKAGTASLPKLPKIPTITPINFLNASDSKASSNPVSGSDAMAIVALGLLGAGAVTVRRRAVHAS